MEEFIHTLQSNSSRYWVLFWSVRLENLISDTIGRILNIDVSTSKSIGFSSGCLSFHQKVLLIKDIKNTTKEIQNKFECFMVIRNKFAHISQVESFKDFFKITNDNDIKRKLTNWYSETDDQNERFEDEYRTKYFKLFNDLMQYLLQLNIQHIRNEVEEQVKKDYNEKLIEILKEKNQNVPITLEMWNQTINEVVAMMRSNKNSA